MMPTPPRSATYPWINFAALGAFFVTFFFFWPREWSIEHQTWLAMALVFVPLAGLELVRAYLRGEHFFTLRPSHAFDINRALTKCLGLLGTYVVFALYYWLFPIYHNDFYIPFVVLLAGLLPYLLIGGFIYILLLDRYLGGERDGYWEIGQLMLGQRQGRNWQIIGQHVLGWLVKAFFLPLMYASLGNNIADTDRLFQDAGTSFMAMYFFLYSLSFLVDLLFVVIGYICTFKFTDSHIRTTEPTMLGWLVALVCYQPFWALIYDNYLSYGGNGWDVWLKDYPVLLWVWGSAILVCVGIYAWASVCFGLRFSNLTYRGLIAHGPYRFTKHPAYVSKNLSWWLISIPFVVGASFEASLRQCLLLLLLNLIYYLRAYTEEQHLSRYPEYREYLRYMDKYDVLRWIPKLKLFTVPRHA